MPGDPRERFVLAAHGLSFSVGGVHIVEDVTLQVAGGEFLAVIGPNGAGKSTLFNLLSGLLRPTAGRVELLGRDVTRQPPFRRARLGLARNFQVTSLFPQLSVVENVRVAAQAALGGSLRPWLLVRRNDVAMEKAYAALEAVGLQDRADDAAALLSHGNKRKLDLAVAMAGEPRVLLLDEPTAGMSVEDVPEVIDVIRHIHEGGTTILMVEHRMDLVLDLADRVAVMHHGALLACDEPELVMANETVQSAYLGESL